MSQLFRALKKNPKNQQTPPNQCLPDNETTSTPEKEPSVTLENAQNLRITDLISESAVPATEEDPNEAEENARFEKLVQDLQQHCNQLDGFIETSQNMLDAAYVSDAQKILQHRLKTRVAELMGIQTQIKTVADNIQSMKMQIAAVKSNADDHKSKLGTLKAEERRTRFLLTHENNKREKNVRNQEKSLHKDRDMALSKYYITSSCNGVTSSRPGGNSATRTTYVSIPGSVDSNASTNTNSINSGSNRANRSSNRPLASAVKRVKTIRNKKDAVLPVPQNEENGVVLYLHPITEPTTDRTEKQNGAQSHHSTPSTSIVNFSWFNNNQPDQTHSDTATNSAVSASNSLFVFSSSGRFDDLD